MHALVESFNRNAFVIHRHYNQTQSMPSRISYSSWEDVDTKNEPCKRSDRAGGSRTSHRRCCFRDREGCGQQKKEHFWMATLGEQVPTSQMTGTYTHITGQTLRNENTKGVGDQEWEETKA